MICSHLSPPSRWRIRERSGRGAAKRTIAITINPRAAPAPWLPTDTMHSPHLPKRRSIRLRDYDYTQAGAYFVTIVAADRADRFGFIQDGEMHLNPLGQCITREWQRLVARFEGLELDSYILMPNHLHGILMLFPARQPRAEPTNTLPHVDPQSLSAIIRAFKSSTTLLYHHMRGSGPLWQRNYYEHILRGPSDLDNTRAYIFANPAQWELDHENLNRH